MLQQTPSAQKPVAHSAGVEHAPPCGMPVLVGVAVGVAVGVGVGVLVGVCVGGHTAAGQTTVTVKLHELECPALSTLVQVTVVVPTGNALPGGIQVKLLMLHASEHDAA